MKLCKMKYKNFEFPLNPSAVEIKYSSNINEASIVESDSAVELISKNATIVTGEGSFFGEDAFTLASELERLSAEHDSGWLFLPNGACFDVFLKELFIKSDARKNEVFYSFKFIENCNHRKSRLELDFVKARKNENLFDIAHRCRKPLEKIMELNNFKSPFDIKEGDRVALK